MKNKFTEEDKEIVVKFLNLVAKEATFSFNTQQVIEYFKLLSGMQQTILPKIDENIMEIKKIIESEESEE